MSGESFHVRIFGILHSSDGSLGPLPPGVHDLFDAACACWRHYRWASRLQNEYCQISKWQVSRVSFRIFVRLSARNGCRNSYRECGHTDNHFAVNESPFRRGSLTDIAVMLKFHWASIWKLHSGPNRITHRRQTWIAFLQICGISTWQIIIVCFEVRFYERHRSQQQ